MKERDQAKNDLEVEKVDNKLCTDDGLQTIHLQWMMCLRNKVFTLSSLVQSIYNKLVPQILEP